jgi:hypothetical protein
MCSHGGHCPEANAPNCCEAHVVDDRRDQGWCRLCNGVILFTDGHYMTPDGEDHLVPLTA